VRENAECCGRLGKMIRSIKLIIFGSILLSVCYLLTFPMATETESSVPPAKVVEGVNGQSKVVVHHHDGAELEVRCVCVAYTSTRLPLSSVHHWEHSAPSAMQLYLHGATVTSFKTASKQQLIFVSSKAIFDGVM
jgi:hypothetical protein